MTAAARRLQSLASLLAHVRERLGVDVGFVLWDGTRVPTDLKDNAMAFAIADEGAVAALRRQGLEDAELGALERDRDASQIAAVARGFVSVAS